MLIKLVNATADLLKEQGYARLELQLDSTGGHEATYYTAEGVERMALRALPVSDGVMDEMVEAAAKALCRAMSFNPDMIYDGKPDWHRWKSQARAALEASRSTTSPAYD